MHFRGVQVLIGGLLLDIWNILIGTEDFNLLVTENPYGGEIIDEDILGECF